MSKGKEASEKTLKWAGLVAVRNWVNGQRQWKTGEAELRGASRADPVDAAVSETIGLSHFKCSFQLTW